MKITQQGTPSMLLETYRSNAGKTCAPASHGADGGPGCVAGDKIQLSETARNLLAMEQPAASGTNLEKETVARIKLEVEHGTYRPDARRIAVGLMKESLQQALWLHQMQAPLTR